MGYLANVEKIEWRKNREERWKSVFEKKPSLAKRMHDSLTTFDKFFSWFSRGYTAAAYWALNDFLSEQSEDVNPLQLVDKRESLFNSFIKEGKYTVLGVEQIYGHHPQPTYRLSVKPDDEGETTSTISFWGALPLDLSDGKSSILATTLIRTIDDIYKPTSPSVDLSGVYHKEAICIRKNNGSYDSVDKRQTISEVNKHIDSLLN